MVEKSHTAGWWPSLYEPLRSARERIADWFAPASEASSDTEAYHIVVELPGVSEDAVEVTVHERVLTVKGEKRSERQSSGTSFYFSERQYGAFQRSFRLPEDADVAAIVADMKDGLLSVRVPKVGERHGSQQKIAVKKG